MNQLLYRGPAIQVLHQQYAKQGRIDERAPVTTTYEVHVDAAVQRVWELLANPPGWPTFAPDIHDVHLDAPVAADTRFTWANGRARITSRFAVVDPGRELTWTGVSSGFRVVHRHLLDTTSDTTTRVRCEESMAGPLLVLFYNSAKLQAGMKEWLTALKTAAEAGANSHPAGLLRPHLGGLPGPLRSYLASSLGALASSTRPRPTRTLTARTRPAIRLVWWQRPRRKWAALPLRLEPR